VKKPKTPKFSVEARLFDKAIEKSNSVRLLRNEKIQPPIRWAGHWWTVTSFMLSHSRSWASVYEVVPLDEWDGEVYVFGCYDEHWIADRGRSGLFWHGVKVQVQGRPNEFVLSTKVQWVRQEPIRKSNPSGSPE